MQISAVKEILLRDYFNPNYTANRNKKRHYLNLLAYSFLIQSMQEKANNALLGTEMANYIFKAFCAFETEFSSN